MSHATAAATATVPNAAAFHPAFRAATPEVDDAGDAAEAQRIAAMLVQLAEAVTPQRRLVHAGDVIVRAGTPFTHLHVLNAGIAKLVNCAADGREQVVGLKFRGDWLGFDGIAHGVAEGDAIALDTGEVWSFRYDELLAACAQRPALLAQMHLAMSREIAGERSSLMSVCTLQADARVVEFLRGWASSLARRGMRTDQITLRLTRAEIGSYLGLTLETVSRSLSKLAQCGLITFADRARRELAIPDVTALGRYVQRSLMLQ